MAKSKSKAGAGKAPRKSGKGKAPTMAQQADRHRLYQLSVQMPDVEIEFFERVFKDLRGSKPKSLREDFCGTGYLSTAWVKSHRERTAVGVDIDPDPLAWGKQHNMEGLSAQARSRLTLHEADVLDGVGEPTQIACAMNFSFCVFKQREVLQRYFRTAHGKLTEDGLFILEIYGGTEAIIELEERRKCEGFTYVWEQELYNPIDHHTLCHIHFAFPDRSKLERAFTYDWRLWSIPELRELLLGAGFQSVTVYWETTDEDGEGTGEFEPTVKEENQESWLVYVVAAK